MEGLMTHFHERNFVNRNVIVRSSAFFFVGRSNYQQVTGRPGIFYTSPFG